MTDIDELIFKPISEEEKKRVIRNFINPCCKDYPDLECYNKSSCIEEGECSRSRAACCDYG